MKKITLEICHDEATGSLQLSICNENGGYRISGLKFTGKSKNLVTHIVTQRDADEIRGYLNSVFGADRSERSITLEELDALSPLPLGKRARCTYCTCQNNMYNCRSNRHIPDDIKPPMPNV